MSLECNDKVDDHGGDQGAMFAFGDIQNSMPVATIDKVTIISESEPSQFQICFQQTSGYDVKFCTHVVRIQFVVLISMAGVTWPHHKQMGTLHSCVADHRWGRKGTHQEDLLGRFLSTYQQQLLHIPNERCDVHPLKKALRPIQYRWSMVRFVREVGTHAETWRMSRTRDAYTDHSCNFSVTSHSQTLHWCSGQWFALVVS